MEPKRAANGSLVYRADKFPRGIKPLADYAHSKGLKFGIYSAHGARTCMGNAASGGDEPHWQQDADLFASWVRQCLYSVASLCMVGFGPKLVCDTRMSCWQCVIIMLCCWWHMNRAWTI